MRSHFGISIVCAILAIVSSAHATTARINYTYDSIGRLTEVNYDSGQEMKYGYDPAGNITKVSNWAAASETVISPTSISVPSSDSDGSFTVTWGASSTAGVTYVLEEATDSAFTQTLRSAYTGSSTSALIYGKTTGSLYYRVKAYKEGYKDSTWRTAGNACTVILPSVTEPGTPVINSIIAGAGYATIYFTPPSSNGGASIVEYTAICVADGEYTQVATSATTFIVVTDLTIGVEYDCTVSASNSAGYTGNSSAAQTVIPVEKDPFPWLLFLPAIQHGPGKM